MSGDPLSQNKQSLGDVDLALRYLELLFPLDRLILKEIFYKVIMLIAL